jgi:polyphosphate kinase
VVYGVVGLKTHAKMMLVTRREGNRLVRYAHLSTGNYNPGTARLYTDVSYLTADAGLTMDIEQVFLHLASQNRLPRLHKALIAPFHLHKAMLEKMEAASLAALQGQRARIVLKMNALTDEALARGLAHASQCGVSIDLIIRGACILPTGLPGITHNVRVRSVIGRLLEHSRVFHFQIGDLDELWLSSADWMNRNMLRRIELAWPVTDPVRKQRVIDECLSLYLSDSRDAWALQPDGIYARVLPEGTGRPGRAHAAVSAQATLMTRFGRKG